MKDCEYIQDEGETVDLIIYEELVRWELEAEWEEWVNSVGWSD